MKARAALLGIALSLATAWAPDASAGLTSSQLSDVQAQPLSGARLPLAATVHDANGPDMSLGDALAGRPALLVPVDYRCRSLCGPALALLAPLLSQTRFRLGVDYTVLVLGMDPRDSDAEALAMAQAQLGPAAGQSGVRILSGGADTLGRIFATLGYRTEYDGEAGRFAHPAAAFAIAADGRVARTLSTLALDPTDLNLALTEAGGGGRGALADRLILLCYGFDPIQGVYTPAIRRVLGLAGLATLIALAGGVAALARHSRRSGEAG